MQSILFGSDTYYNKENEIDNLLISHNPHLSFLTLYDMATVKQKGKAFTKSLLTTILLQRVFHI
jgi:hypothetical protein